MHPVLFKIGSLTLYTYGLFVALGFISAIWWSKKLARKHDINHEFIYDVYIVILVSAIIGARALYIIIEFNSFSSDWLSVFKIWNGGLVFYGGFISSFIATVLYLHLKKSSLWLMGDIIAPGVALGHAIGRIGCFFAGCCYGRSCDLPWAIQFKNHDSLAPLNIFLHPTQIYEILSNLLIFVILMWVGHKKKTHGVVFFVYLILYSLFRSFIEFFRGDFRGNLFNGYVSTSQAIGIFFAVLGIVFLIRLLPKKNDTN